MPEGLTSTLRELAQRILKHPGDQGLDRELQALVATHGEIVYEILTDTLVANTPGTYSQQDQDRALRWHRPAELRPPTQLPIILLSNLPNYLELSDRGIVDLVADLIPSDFFVLGKEARLTWIEWQVWDYFLMDGYKIAQIAQLLTKRDGTPYTERAIRYALERAKFKIRRCPSLGWRTCLLEDILRGKHDQPPDRVRCLLALTRDT